MGTESDIFKLDLDSSDFVEALKKAGESLEALGGKAEGLDSIISGIGTATKLLGTMAIAFLAVKSAIDWVEQAEEIRLVNQQFEMLTAGAGIASETLKRGLEESSRGLITENELLKLSNKAIIELGDNAKKLPEIMDLARKVTAAFGGELSTNFGAINQAIATGQTRLLKHMGLVIDANKAYIDYAKSIGTTAAALSESGKQAALMNAVLEKGQTSFKGVSGDGLETKNTLTSITVAAKELGEAFALAFDKTAGPAVRNILSYVKEFAQWVSTKVKHSTDEWKESLEGINKETFELTDKLHDLKARLGSGNEQNSIYKYIFGGVDKDEINKQISAVQVKLDDLASKKKSLDATSKTESPGSAIAPTSKINHTADLAQEAKFQKDIEKLRDEAMKEEEKNFTTIAQVEKHVTDQKVQLARDTAAKIGEINAMAEAGKLKPGQKEQLEEQTMKVHLGKMEALDQDLTNKKIAALQRFSQFSNSSAKQFAAGWEQASLKAVQANSNMANLGQKAFSSLNSQAKSAFIAMGDGSKTAGDAMKGFLLGSIADIAESQGEFLLASGIGTYDPVQIAEGGALLALSGLLRSQAGGASSSLGAGGGGGGVSASAPSAPSGGTALPPAQASAQKSVTLQVMGSIYETEQTKQRLMDLLRSETDATSYKYQQIGV